MSARDLHDRLCSIRLGAGAAPHVTLRRELVAALAAAEEDGATLDLFDTDWSTVPDLDEATLVAAPPHLLLAWCDDADGCTLFAIPLDAPAPLDRIVADARALRGHCFADGSDGTPAQLGAAVRVLVAIGRGSVQAHYDGWAREIAGRGGAAAVGIGSADDLAPYHRALAGLAVGAPSRLSHRIVEVVSVNKAM